MGFQMPNKMNARNKDSEAMLPFWQKVALVMGGQTAVKEAAEEMLPLLPMEETKQYKFRLQVAKFTNIYRDVVEGLAAKPFAEEIRIVGESIPQPIANFAEDVDGDGNNLTVFAAQYFMNGINDAIAWLFVDYPNDSARTLAEAKKKNMRPFWSLVMAQNILEVQTKMIGGKRAISYIRILEPEANGNPERVRVFKMNDAGAVVWELWQESEKTKDEFDLIENGTLTINQIPMIPFITGKRDGKRFYFDGPLKSALELQETLYHQESALEYAKVMTAFPMLSASGVSPALNADNTAKPIVVGPHTVLYAPMNGDGKSGAWSYVEPGAQSLEFLKKDVESTKQDLRELGKQPLSAQAGLTVISTAYAAGKSKSAVNAWGLGLKDALENAMVLTAQYLAVAIEPQIAVYDDYDTFTDEDFNGVLEMRKAGDLSQETLWTEARRRSVLSNDFDPVKEAARLLLETPGDGNDEFDSNPNTEE